MKVVENLKKWKRSSSVAPNQPITEAKDFILPDEISPVVILSHKILLFENN
jgi:hypothetical protein